MSFGTAIATCFAKFVVFSGRASRSEYWKFYLFILICIIGGLVVDVLMGMPLIDEDGEFIGGPIFWLTVLVSMVPVSSASVRRLHDTDRSGWWYWVQLIPIIGPIIFLVWMCTRGDPGSNNYGDDSLGPDTASVFE